MCFFTNQVTQVISATHMKNLKFLSLLHLFQGYYIVTNLYILRVKFVTITCFCIIISQTHLKYSFSGKNLEILSPEPVTLI